MSGGPNCSVVAGSASPFLGTSSVLMGPVDDAIDMVQIPVQISAPLCFLRQRVKNVI